MRLTLLLIACLLSLFANGSVLAAEPQRAALSKPGEVSEVEIAKGVKMKFCWIPAGKATLGDPNEKDNKEYEFTTKGFWMGKYTVTQEEWQAVMGDNPSWFKPTEEEIKKAGIKDTSRFPVEWVSWNDCQDFLKKLNDKATMPELMGKGKFVLPHEDDWEYACRGGLGNKRKYYWGDVLTGDKANCRGDGPDGTDVKGPYLKRTTEVGSYEKAAPHPWNLCDMHGNVWQWCENKYSPDWDRRVLRGGSWCINAKFCRSAFRVNDAPDVHYLLNGFRVVVALP